MKSSAGEQWIWRTIFVSSIIGLGYGVDRTETLLFAVAASAFWRLAVISTETSLFGLGLLARLSLFFCVPALSDDYFRFLWDGMLSWQGVSPYLQTPAEIINAGTLVDVPFSIELYEGLNSKNYHAVYPPVLQWLFLVAASLKSVFGGVLILKSFLLLAELGVYWMLKKLLDRYGLPLSNIVWYWLNPLLILEGIGNLHFEPVMLFFLLSSVYHFSKLRESDGAFSFAFAALSKWFSVLFLPLVLWKVSFKRALKIVLVTLVTSVCLYLPFWSVEESANQLQSIFLFIQRFEFNASFYYLINGVGEYLVGYNLNRIIGPSLILFSGLLILLISWVYRFRNRLKMLEGMLFISSVFLFLSPVVHPWYLFVPVALSVFTKFKYPVWWSILAFMSYSAYANAVVQENMWFLMLEYGIVFLILLREIKGRNVYPKILAAFSRT